MNPKVKRIASGLLAATLLATTFTGCGKKKVEEDKRVVTLPPENQIFVDTYVQNPNISEWMTYTTDVTTFIKNPEDPPAKQKRKVALWQLFKNNTVQVDCMDLFTMGSSTMGDIVAAVDKANETMINNAIESVREQRQKIIDDEYNAAKAAAEAKGKTYTKEKKVADISDLSYVNPYSYKLAYDNTEKKTKEQYPYIWDVYEPNKLIDPTVDNEIHLFIYKYDVPYVQCTFQLSEGKSTYSTNQIIRMYNNQIDHEKDWVLTKISPADCRFLVDITSENPPPLPSYIDIDKKSLGSKNNMITDGNIKFGGEGFTWDSLRTLCDALDLTSQTEEVTSWRKQTSEVSNNQACTFLTESDENFTYYTIFLPINHFFKQASGDYAIPIAKLTATFNKTTNNCIGWSIDYATSYHVFPKSVIHQTGDVVSVNVREHKLDTADYKGMLKTVDDWVKDNATTADFGYYLVDTNGTIIGKIENGLSNYHVEIQVGDEIYTCTKAPQQDSEMNGYYLSDTELQKLVNANPEMPLEDIMAQNANLYYIVCMATTKSSKGTIQPLAYFQNSGIMATADNSQNQYYIHYIEYDKMTGYKNAIIIDQDVYNNLFEMYIRTFRFGTEELDALDTLYDSGDTLKMREYVSDYVNVNEKNKETTTSSITEQASSGNPTIVITNIQGNLEGDELPEYMKEGYTEN